MERKQTGKTKDTGWQAGARRTYPVTAAALWDTAVSAPGQTSLGAAAEGLSAETAGVTTFRPGSHYRRKVARAGSLAVFQLRVLPAATGATLALMYQDLSGPGDREAALEEFQKALEAFAALIGPPVRR